MELNLSHEDYLILAETMSRYGGNFCIKLADAIRAADPTNKKKIVQAFPEIVEKYGRGSSLSKLAGFAHV